MNTPPLSTTFPSTGITPLSTIPSFVSNPLAAPIAASTAPISSPTTAALSSFNTTLLVDSINLFTTGLAAFSQFQTSRFQARSAEFQADMIRIRSAQENLKAREEVLALRRKAQKDRGRSQALFAARGIRVGEGTAQQALERSAIQESEAIETLTFGGQRRASQLDFAADITSAEGSVARSLGLLGIGSSLKQSLLTFNPPTKS